MPSLISAIRATALLLATASIVEVRANPQGNSASYVGFGDNCGVIGGVNYLCWPNTGLTCDTMPGQSQTICVKTAQAGQACDPEHTKCASGLTCNTPPGQWAGTCSGGGGPAPPPPPPPGPPPTPAPSPGPAPGTYVGLGNQCGLIGGTNYLCWPNVGLTCDKMPGQSQTICVKTAQAGQACNPENTKCASGLTCSTPPGQWAGTCSGGGGPTPPPPPPPGPAPGTYVGLGNQCGVIGGVNYICWPNTGLTCDTMPGQSQTTCVKTAQAGQACNPENTKCASGLTCRVPPGQWAGTCN